MATWPPALLPVFFCLVLACASFLQQTCLSVISEEVIHYTHTFFVCLFLRYQILFQHTAWVLSFSSFFILLYKFARSCDKCRKRTVFLKLLRTLPRCWRATCYNDYRTQNCVHKGQMSVQGQFPLLSALFVIIKKKKENFSRKMASFISSLLRVHCHLLKYKFKSDAANHHKLSWSAMMSCSSNVPGTGSPHCTEHSKNKSIVKIKPTDFQNP